jgi:hypothetical protein
MASESNPRVALWAAVGAVATVAGVIVAILQGGLGALTRRSPLDPASTTAAAVTNVELASRDSSGFSAAERELLGRISRTVFKSCRPRPAAERDGVVAAFNCQVVDAGPTRQPLVRQFMNTSALNDYMSLRRKLIVTAGTCRDGLAEIRTWNNSASTVTMGDLLCDRTDNLFRVEWSYYALNIAIVAEGTSARELYRWWESIRYRVFAL